jgi:hypothetical protein
MSAGGQRSYVEANVPQEGDFDVYLKRDIEQFFRSNGTEFTEVHIELLRMEPTQSGVALPKYYLWVQVLDNSKVVSEGAIRVAAEDKDRFEVTHFLPKEEIAENPDSIHSTFPGDLCQDILARAKKDTL